LRYTQRLSKAHERFPDALLTKEMMRPIAAANDGRGMKG
jgi:hypothetical protein